MWNDFFWAEQSLLNLDIYRICLGVILIVNGLLMWRQRLDLFSVNGLFSYSAYEGSGSYYNFSLFKYLPKTDKAVTLLLSMYLFFAIALTIGLFSKAAVLGLFIITVSLHNRNPFCINGGDVVLRLSLFLLIFTPVGHLWSVDAVLFDYQSISPIWSVRLLQILVACLYFHTFLWKLAGKMWRNGTAAYYVFYQPNYRRISMPNVFDKAWIYKGLTYLVLVTELSLGTLIWIPLFRPYVLLAGVMMHLGLELFGHYQLFEWVMICSLLLFLPL